MKNSVAKYPWMPWAWQSPTPAPWTYEKKFRRHLDGLLAGLWLLGWRISNPDSLTVKKPTVSAVSVGYVIDKAMKFANLDDMTAKSLNHSYTCARGRVCMQICVCHVVILSISYIYIYKSISYNTDNTLTLPDSGLLWLALVLFSVDCLWGVGARSLGFLGAWRG
jgi:hypothetical protein